MLLPHARSRQESAAPGRPALAGTGGPLVAGWPPGAAAPLPWCCLTVNVVVQVHGGGKHGVQLHLWDAERERERGRAARGRQPQVCARCRLARQRRRAEQQRRRAHAGSPAHLSPAQLVLAVAHAVLQPCHARNLLRRDGAGREECIRPALRAAASEQ